MATLDDSPRSTSRTPGPLRKAVRIVSARLRFLAVFLAVFLIIGSWETIRTYWGRMTAGPGAEKVISSDTDYFCPMDPGVLSDWPSKCPVCNMTLVRRKKGDAAPLPDGVVARMQFTPYRLWLGGIGTATVDYAPLAHTFDVPGTVAVAGSGACRLEAEVFVRELSWIKPGDSVEVSPFGAETAASLKGKVGEVPRPPNEPGGVAKVVIGLEGQPEALRAGDRMRVRFREPVDRADSIRSLPSTPPALAKHEPRTVYACMEHADVLRDSPGRCPRDQSELMARSLRPNQRVRWWCPMHPSVTSDGPNAKCEACGGMVLVPRVISYRLPGTVLSVPASAVIDDGSRSLVYVDRGAGMFDATVVTLGPRCGESFPVISGLEPGDRVAAKGAFLIDAETRLNPSLAAGYFGAGERAGGQTPVKAQGANESEWAAELAPPDRSLAIRQKTCPVTGKPLGSMGTPAKVDIRGRKVFLCCDGCTGAMESDPDKYLAKLPRADGGGEP